MAEVKGELILPRKPQLQILYRQSVLDFGIISNGQKKTLSFSIKNCGEEDLIVELAVNENWISINPSKIGDLKKGDSREIIISAEPKNTELGKHRLSLSINSNDLLEKIKQIYILAQVEEANNSIELYPNQINLNEIYNTRKTEVKVEVKNISNPSEEASIEVEIEQKDTSYLSYEITSHKGQTYIDFYIEPQKLPPGNYETKVKIRELFSPYSIPLELPFSFVLSEDDGKTATNHTKEKVEKFIKDLVFEENQEEDKDILYTDKKTYSYRKMPIIIISVILLIIVAIVILIFSK